MQSRQRQRELSDLRAAHQQAEQISALALRERNIQSALAITYASQLERLGDLPEQVRAALTAPEAAEQTRTKPPCKERSGKQFSSLLRTPLPRIDGEAPDP